MSASEMRIAVLLGMQVALLGAIGRGVRRVSCTWAEHEIKIRAIFDGEIGQAEAEAMREAETEMMAQFPHHDVELTCERCDAPQPAPRYVNEHAVFARLED